MTQAFRTITLNDLHSLSYLTDRGSCITRRLLHKGKNGRTSRTTAVYFGFSTYEAAQRFASQLNRRTIVRQAVRSLDWEWDVKVQGDMSLEEIWAIAKTLDKFYPVNPEFSSFQPLPTNWHVAQHQFDRYIQHQSKAKADIRSRAMFA